MTPVVDQERFLERQLLKMGGKFSWVCDPAVRRQRFRRAIIDGFIDQALVGKKLNGQYESFCQLFERIFKEPLRPHLPATTLRENIMSEKIHTIEVTCVGVDPDKIMSGIRNGMHTAGFVPDRILLKGSADVAAADAPLEAPAAEQPKVEAES